MEDHLYSISNESNSIILSAAANYKKFAQDTLVGVDRWIEKSEEELKSLKKEKKKVSNEFKQVRFPLICVYTYRSQTRTPCISNFAVHYITTNLL